MNYLFRILALTAVSIIAGNVYSAEQAPIIQVRTLSSHIAHKIVFTAVENCTKKGNKVSAAVVDRNGNLSAFLRDPLSGPHSIKVSQQKAYTSATFQVATSELASRTDLAFAPGILLIAGGVPINIGGHFYGGVAVSGAEPEIDAKCSQAGIDAVAEILEFAD